MYRHVYIPLTDLGKTDMQIEHCMVGRKPAYRFGPEGTMYEYTGGDQRERLLARKRAEKDEKDWIEQQKQKEIDRAEELQRSGIEAVEGQIAVMCGEESKEAIPVQPNSKSNVGSDVVPINKPQKENVTPEVVSDKEIVGYTIENMKRVPVYKK